MNDHSNHVILVTGATRGLGLSLASKLADVGFKVIATGRQLTPGLRKLIEEKGVAFETLDLEDHAEIHNSIKMMTAKHGNIYGLVNNAAVGYDGVLATMHDSQIANLVAINITGTLLITKYAVRSMLLNRKGRIVNISSIIAETGFNGLSVYAASKSALIGFTRSLAREVGKANITVNAVAPGYMMTDMTRGLQGDKLETIKRRSPLGQLVDVDDVAAAVAWLMSPAAAMITGTTLTVDAGSTA